ncbi:hypothetical protein [Haloarcula argentinensis]|uniref:Uncharacterized protein n=1 Tax=Haloarcula argentinensis TaxID=43776 RepID=A0A847UN28_HALAR|nr:hypothetical protein [Haloarcula argentinensis]NLV13231.1 hypothetical protein [Haloarcula argentinensis]
MDEFGRMLGEQVRDQIRWEYFLDEEQHIRKEEYSSDVSHQDGNLPYRMQISHVDGGPSYLVNDYFPHFHYQAGYTLASESYDLMIEYWGEENVCLGDLEVESIAVEQLLDRGAEKSLSYLKLF